MIVAVHLMLVALSFYRGMYCLGSVSLSPYVYMFLGDIGMIAYCLAILYAVLWYHFGIY